MSPGLIPHFTPVLRAVPGTINGRKALSLNAGCLNVPGLCTARGQPIPTLSKQFNDWRSSTCQSLPWKGSACWRGCLLAPRQGHAGLHQLSLTPSSPLRPSEMDTHQGESHDFEKHQRPGAQGTCFLFLALPFISWGTLGSHFVSFLIW